LHRRLIFNGKVAETTATLQKLFRMKKPSVIFLLFLTIAIMLFNTACNPADEPLLQELDAVIAGKEMYRTNKELMLANIKKSLGNTRPDALRYEIYSQLYNEYTHYAVDSAFLYAMQKLELAKEMRDEKLVQQSNLDLAQLYVYTGVYTAALTILDAVARPIDKKFLPAYYHVRKTCYEAMAAECQLPSQKKAYATQMALYRDSLRNCLHKPDIAWFFVTTEAMIENGHYEDVLHLLLPLIEDSSVYVHDKAILAYIVARAYNGLGNRQQAIHYFAISAVNDLKTPVREYRSLQYLAMLLYETGDVSRAYRYISTAINDAIASSANMNLPFISTLIPVISNAYQIKMQDKENRQRTMIWIISMLLLLLAIALMIVYRQKRKVIIAERKKQTVNNQLFELNKELTGINAKMHDANQIKETYVIKYMNLCSQYIGRVETYRLHLNKIAKTEGATAMMQALQSSVFLDDKLKEFYDNFDSTFLHLFPQFVEQFNNLLRDEGRITLKAGKLLNTELRVFALIRLGITDSAKIAEFLRHSVNTVYNYRIKMRALALNKTDDFEKQVMTLG
jgi:tetratricopeptide (TPR) repeat protein